MDPSASSATEPQDDYETVVTGDSVRTTRPADDPAGFATVLEIRDAPAGTELPDLLLSVPGLRVRDSGPGGRRSIALRGTDSHQAVVLLDGIRLSSPAQGGFDLALLDAGHLERAEVRRGGAGTRFGTNAVGGILSLQTRTLRSQPRTRVSAAYGSWRSIAARISRADALGDVRYLVSGSYKDSAGDFTYVDPNGVSAVRRNNDSRMGELLLKSDYLASTRWHVSLLNDLALGERGAPGMSSAPCATARQMDLRNLTALKATRWGTVVDQGQLELTLFHRYGRFRFDDVCLHNQPSAADSFGGGASARLVLPFGAAGRVDAGAEVRGEVLRDLLGSLADDRPRRLQADLWSSAQVRPLGEYLVLVPAVRLATSSDHGAVVVPRFGAVVRPLLWAGSESLGALALAGNIGRSFRVPSFPEMYINLDSLRGNPDLQPEDALDGDIGLRWQAAAVSVEAAYFRRWIKNVILFAPVSPFLVEARNYSGTLAHGAEASFGARLPAGFGLNAAYTYTRTRFGDPPILELPGHPRHRLVTRLSWERQLGSAPRRRWGVGLWSGATAESSMYLDRHNSRSRVFREEGRVLLSAGGAVTYRSLSLSAEGRNLLDKRDAVDTFGFPLAPAQFLLSLAAAL